MANRRVPAQEKKIKGSFNVTRDEGTEFTLWDGQVRKCPIPPDDFTEMELEEWKIVWRHLIKHEYGKDADYRLVEIYVRELGRYFKYSQFEQTYHLGCKAWSNLRQASEMLGLNPAAMSKVAALQKPKKSNKLAEALDKVGT